jgi:hypothetical protein
MATSQAPWEKNQHFHVEPGDPKGCLKVTLTSSGHLGPGLFNLALVSLKICRVLIF